MATKKADPCQALRDRVATSEAKIQEMEDRLPETPPLKRPPLREAIKKEKERLNRLRRLLAACLAAQ